ncbi:MAG: hypothetical protein WAM39_32960 [Bryobacteraceae bacterium]
MTITTLQKYNEIKTSPHSPRTTRRPSLALSNETSTMFMAYTGEHSDYQGIWKVSGRRVWWVQSPSAGSPTSWTQNEPVEFGGSNPLPTQDDVAMVIYQGFPGIIVNWPLGIVAAWFDGNQWTVDDTVPTASHLSKGPKAPIAVVAKNVLHVFFEAGGMLNHLMRSAPPFTITSANWTQQTTNLPVTPLSATVADDGTILVLCSPQSNSGSQLLNYLVADPPDDPINWGSRMAAIEPAHDSPLPTNDAAIATDILGTVNLVYRAHGKGKTLFFAATDPTDTSTLQQLKTIPAQSLKLAPSFDVQIDHAGGKIQKAETQSAPCLYQGGRNMGFLAHQGASSNDIWFGVFADMS